jgi:hypothetical protein
MSPCLSIFTLKTDQCVDADMAVEFIKNRYFTLHTDFQPAPPTIFLFMGKTIRTVAFYGYERLPTEDKWKWDDIMNRYVKKFYPKMAALCCEYPKGKFQILIETKERQDLHTFNIRGTPGMRGIAEKDDTLLAPGSIICEGGWCFFNKENSTALN